MSKYGRQCKELLILDGININSSIEFDVNGKIHTLTFEYIIDTFMQASNDSQIVFVESLSKAISAKDMGVDKFFEGMGQLLLMTHLSENI